MSYNMEHPFAQLGSAVITVSSSRFLLILSLFLSQQITGVSRTGLIYMGWGERRVRNVQKYSYYTVQKMLAALSEYS